MTGHRPDDQPALAFVVVRDVAASWTTYESRAPAPGLVLHVAGPTDDGYRTIEVWASATAYEVHQRVHGDDRPADLVVPPVVRALHVLAGWAPGLAAGEDALYRR